MGLSITSTPVATPPVFAKSRRLDPEKLQIAKAEFKRLESAGIIHHSKPPWYPKMMVLAALWRLSPSQFGDNP
jgi:hypothetical protein